VRKRLEENNMTEKREVTARIKITINGDNINVKTKNIFSFYESVTIISTAIAILGDGELSKLGSYEWDYFDGEAPCVCLAYNLETKELQVSVNDIAENIEIGLLEAAKQIVIKDILGS